jgi:carbonic anhydrase
MTDKLFEGYQRFREGYFEKNKDRLEQLALSQAPEVAIVSCCDSRVDPGILFDADPGEIFVIRNVANLVPPYETTGNYHGTSAALEFAVTCLKVKQIVILGHANCGGIKSLMENETSFQAEGFIDSWMNLAAKAKKEVLEREDLHDMQQKIHACEKTAVNHSLQNLMLYPWIKDRVEAGELELLGCFYDLRNGELQILDKIGSSVTRND